MPAKESWRGFGLLKDIGSLYSHMSRRRHLQLAALLLLQLIGGASEVVSLGAVIPFLGALVNAEKILANPDYQPWIELLGITEASSLITVFATLFAVAAIGVSALRLFTLWAQGRLAAAIGSDLSKEVYRRNLYQPFEFHINTNSSTLIGNITNDLNGGLATIRNTLMLVTQGWVVVFVSGALLAYNWAVAVSVSVVIAMSYLFIMKTTRWRLVRNSQLGSDLFIQRLKTLQEGFGGIRDVLLDGHQPSFADIFAKTDRKMRRIAANNQIMKTAPRNLMEMMAIGTLCGVAVFVAGDATNNADIVPLLGAIAVAASRLLPAVQQCYSSIAGIMGVHASLQRALASLALPVDKRQVKNISDSLPLSRSISLDNIYFSYGSQPKGEVGASWTLKGIDLDIQANTTVAFVGHTGGGKSTIADIIMGLLNPQKGRVLVDDSEIDDNNTMAWRAKVGHVPQSIYMCDVTIAENIAFGIPKAKINMEQVREAARMASIADFVESRPLGYDEVIGERGIRLSGGQRQRIGIARALYKRPSVIVFDEATSALDTVTEAEVMEAVAGLKGQVTVILIAHRLTTIERADMIFEIRNGRVVASGSYEELLQTSGTFREMARPQA